MSVCGYFNRRGPGLRMPKSNALGIRYQGQVLNGNSSVDEAFAGEKHAEGLHALETALRTGVNSYVTPEDYDPVLRFHTRTGKPGAG